MRVRWIKVALVLAVAAVTATAAKKDSSLQSHLETEFLGKSFITKIRLGSYLTYYHDGLQRNCNRLIDTEFSPDGSIQYQARKGCFSQTGGVEGDLFSANFYVDPSKITQSMSVGTTVWVGKIEVKDNRIELWLSSALNASTIDAYAKIKFMLGKGYQAWDYDTLMGVLSRALKIEAYERVATLRADYEDLQKQLASGEGRYQGMAGVSANQRLQALRDVRNTLQKIIENRSAYVSTGHSDQDAAHYIDRASALDADIAKLEAEARKERAQDARSRLLNNNSQAARLKSTLQQKAPATFPEWQRWSEALTDYRRLLDEQQMLHGLLTANGEPVAAADIAKLQQAIEEADTIGESLARDRQRVQIAQLSSDYRELERKRVQLLDAYTKAFGSAQERPALQALVAHLERMRDNRVAAQELGNSAASSQAAQLRAEIEKFRRR